MYWNHYVANSSNFSREATNLDFLGAISSLSDFENINIYKISKIIYNI